MRTVLTSILLFLSLLSSTLSAPVPCATQTIAINILTGEILSDNTILEGLLANSGTGNKGTGALIGGAYQVNYDGTTTVTATATVTETVTQTAASGTTGRAVPTRTV